MRHLKRTAKLGRTGQHRNAMLANLVCSLILHKRVTTTLAKAKAARSVAEKMVTLGKRGTIQTRRMAAARLHQEDAVKILFNQIAPAQRRAEVISSYFIACFIGNSVPVIGVGWLTSSRGHSIAISALAVVVGSFVLLALALAGWVRKGPAPVRRWSPRARIRPGPQSSLN